MNKNGFIFIVLSLTAASQAGTQLYLPAVGPVALRFASEVSAQSAAALPFDTTSSEMSGKGSRIDMIPEIPVDSPTNVVSGVGSLMHDPPVLNLQHPPMVLGPDEPLIGPMMETNSVVTPQMLMRYFSPSVNGTSRETLVIPPMGFIPGHPPTQSSTVTYSKP